MWDIVQATRIRTKELIAMTSRWISLRLVFPDNSGQIEGIRRVCKGNSRFDRAASSFSVVASYFGGGEGDEYGGATGGPQTSVCLGLKLYSLLCQKVVWKNKALTYPSAGKGI